MTTNMSGKTAIAGLGITEMTREYIGTTEQVAVQAIRMAIEDAGLAKDDIDGLLVNAGVTNDISIGLQKTAGFRNLRLMNHMNAAGSTAGQMVHYAALAIEAGMANAVVCVFADTPLRGGSAGAAYGQIRNTRGMAGMGPAYGFFGANTGYALAARRHMATYGTTHDQLGAIAVSNRKWAEKNPRAMQRKPMTLEDYHNSRWIIEPFHLFDCTLVSNGAVALIVTSAERARSLKQPPAYILGMGQGHPGNPGRAGFENEMNTGAQIARGTAFGMAGIDNSDVDVCEFYDCYTYTTLVTLEDYGFAPKGEGGAFVQNGRIEPGGELPVNTGGGQLSGYYMWGMTPLSEGIIQARGQGGDRQVEKHDCVLVSMQGGLLDFHATLILSPHASNN
ncbi:MAG: thiolase family protein [Chloroflexi bacterium]|nr:thiolase family protein [Chloroflexota bacterium]MDA1002710.1 thiolase family protein [Chloroflexota bacterium]